nr:cytochrome c family protein [uncultured Rhodopila sp.]
MTHRKARVALTGLTAAVFGTLLIQGTALAADPATGKAIFGTSCGICHTVRPGDNKIGPTLFGIVGRKTGAVPDYTYSPANLAANIIWTDAELDKYLEAPRTIIPGTKMAYAGVKDAAKRADLIAYLDTLK